MSQTMSEMELKAHILNFLKEHHEASLATCLNNIPRSSPVLYFLGNNLEIFIYSAGGSKFEALQKNSNVCLLVNTPYLDERKIKGVQVFGKASTSFEDQSLHDEASQYAPKALFSDHNVQNLHVIKILPDEIVYLDSLIDGDRTKQILRNIQALTNDERIVEMI